MDKFDSKKRSEIMSRIKSKDSVAEKIVFRELRRKNIYFQKHYKNAPGKPDIALPRKRRAVFIDGDFWHGRDFIQLSEQRKLSVFWIKKLTGNIDRDKRQLEELAQLNWRVLRVWESDIKRIRTRSAEIEKIVSFLVAD